MVFVPPPPANLSSTAPDLSARVRELIALNAVVRAHPRKLVDRARKIQERMRAEYPSRVGQYQYSTLVARRPEPSA